MNIFTPYSRKIPHYSVADCQKADADMTTLHGVTGKQLMEVAGCRLADFVINHLPTKDSKILVVCGKGNNGGDGVVAARFLHLWRYDVTCAIVGDKNDLSSLPKQHFKSYISLGGNVISVDDIDANYDMIVDAIFGIGLKSAPRNIYAAAINRINNSRATIIAADVPSGFNADTGECYAPCVNADLTLSFACAKNGFRSGKCGSVFIADIGIVMPKVSESFI